jgi:hypothetical protein
VVEIVDPLLLEAGVTAIRGGGLTMILNVT